MSALKPLTRWVSGVSGGGIHGRCFAAEKGDAPPRSYTVWDSRVFEKEVRFTAIIISEG